MKAANGDDDDAKTSAAFRCLNAARYAVAAVVTVLIVAVIVTSLKVVLRAESLRLSVVDGAVYSTPHPAATTSDEAVLTLQLNLRAENPSGRARMYFFNVTAYLFDSATPASTSKPDEDCIIFFEPPDRAVRQEMAVDLMTSVEAINDPGVMNQTYFEMLYAKGAVVGDMTLRVDGSLVTEVSSGINMTRLQVTYYCRPLLVGGSKGGEASNGRKDVLCTDNLGSQ